MIDILLAMGEVPASVGALYAGIKSIQYFQDAYYRRHPEAWPSHMHDADHDPDAIG